MVVEIAVSFEITKKMMEDIADDYLQTIVDNYEGDEKSYREEYENLINDDMDLLIYIEDYDFTLSNGNYFNGLCIEISQRFELCEEIKKIVLKKMEEDLKNF